MQKKEIINVTKTSFIELNHFENEKLIEKCVEEAKIKDIRYSFTFRKHLI